jgi:hypothetical protein
VRPEQVVTQSVKDDDDYDDDDDLQSPKEAFSGFTVIFISIIGDLQN